jgi:hypothetical protein
MTLITVILLSAGILLYALYRKRDVTFNVKLPGAQFLLEARGHGQRDSAKPKTQ